MKLLIIESTPNPTWDIEFLGSYARDPQLVVFKETVTAYFSDWSLLWTDLLSMLYCHSDEVDSLPTELPRQ